MSGLVRAAQASVVLGIAGAGLNSLLSDGAHRARVWAGRRRSAPPPPAATGHSDAARAPAADLGRARPRPCSGQAARPKIRERALLFGDSITQYAWGNKATGEVGGWGALLATEFARTLDIVNRGFSGYTTRGALNVVDHVLGLAPASTTTGDVAPVGASTSTCSVPSAPTTGTSEAVGGADAEGPAGTRRRSIESPGSTGVVDVEEKEFLFVTIFFGANDSTDKALNPAQSVGVDEYRTNLVKLVDRAQSVAQHVVVISPPPVDSVAWARSRELARADRENGRTEEYCEAARAVAEEKGALFVDTFHAMLGYDDWTSFLNDGLHLSPRGNRMLFDLLTAVLRGEAGVSDDALPLDFPLHGDANGGLEVDAAGHFTTKGIQALPYNCRTHDD